MKSFKEKSFGERMNTAAEARKATLARILARSGADHPDVIAQKAKRDAIIAARELRLAERNAARLAAEEHRLAEAEQRTERERIEAADRIAQEAVRAAALAAEQKAARDARYAARKARK